MARRRWEAVNFMRQQRHDPRLHRLLKQAPLVVAFLLLMQPCDVRAAGFNPTVAAGDSLVDLDSLRAAIVAANGNGEDDVFTLEAGTYQLTRTNTGGAQENAAQEGDLDLTESGRTITFNGAGVGTTFIDAQDIDRVFQVFPGVTAIFRDLTITGGRAIDDGTAGATAGTTNALGGGILSSGDVQLDNVQVTSNDAVGADGGNGGPGQDGRPGRDAGGGGIAATAGSLELGGSSIVDFNNATAGNGGNGGNFAISPSRVGAGGTGGVASGGGIFTDSATLTFGEQSTVESNQAAGGDGGTGGTGNDTSTGGAGGSGGDGRGGGIYAAASMLQLSDSTLSSNQAMGGMGGAGGDSGSARGGRGGSGGNGTGGGLFASSGTLNLNRIEISANTGVGGRGGPGGMGAASDFGGGGGTGGSGHGGGLWVGVAGALVTECTIDQNAVSGMSGGTGGDGGMSGSSSLAGGPGGAGGNAQGAGVYVDSQSLNVERSTISRGTASAGSGGNGGNGGTNSSDSDSLTGGHGGMGGGASGGGLYLHSGALTLTNSTASTNSVEGAKGGDGGTGGDSDAAGPINGPGGDGGNGGNGGGGGIYAEAGTLTVNNSTVAANAAAPGSGGAAGTGDPDGSGGSSGLSSGGGVANEAATAGGTSSIFADNIAVSAPDFLGNVSISDSLFEDPSGAAITGSNPQSGQDPMLGVLTNNGGPTETHAIGLTSPALDQGANPLALVTDQRAAPHARTLGAGTDIGAYEVPQPLGAACMDANDCQSGNCADDVCCDAPCDGACDTCGETGACSVDPAGSPGSPSCEPYLCDGSGSACVTTCSTDEQCAPGNTCTTDNECLPSLPLPTSSVPAMSERWIAALSAMLGMLGGFALRRRRKDLE